MDPVEEVKPKWMLELENKKRKPHLAHETGAGSACLVCQTACPGLDLHFWRKICKNCKCRGDDHDVDNDEFPQFELLFGPSSKMKALKRRSIFLKMEKSKENVKQHSLTGTQFDWAPPNINEDLAADYMKALPLNKLPIKGSTGAALRRQQLQKQLPLHDIDHKVCDKLSEEERKQFEKYLTNLKDCVGQGTVSKLISAKPFDRSLMTPANATDVQSLSPQHSQNLNVLSQPLPNLRTPSSFMKSSHVQGSKPFPGYSEVLNSEHLQPRSELANPTQERYYHTLENVTKDGEIAKSDELIGAKLHYLNIKGKQENNAAQKSEAIKGKIERIGEFFDKSVAISNKIPGDINSKGVAVSFNKESHLTKLAHENLNNSQNNNSNPTHSEMPKCRDVQDKNLTSSLQPITRELYPVPTSSDVAYSEKLNNSSFPEQVVYGTNRASLEKKLENQNNESNIINEERKLKKCHQCNEIINCNDVIVTAEKMKDSVWHPGCFVCSTCNELLADLVYFCYKGKLYCGRDLAVHLKIPRCFACDELIFVREYTVAEGHSYHVKHFCCWDCDTPLAGQQYISEDDRPLCLLCYERSYAKICMNCKNVVAADQEGVNIKNLNFHADNKCFCCFQCKKGLLNGKMAIKDDKPFCSKECILEYFHKKL